MNKTIKMNQTRNMQTTIEKLAARLDFKPTNISLFIESLTHSSFANEHATANNERLEFLGDSVLGLIVCQFLFENYPHYNEGDYAKLKSTLVSAAILASFTEYLKLDCYIRLGQGEKKASGNHKQNIMADLFEAFIGAYYLNFGLEKTAEFILPLIRQKLPEVLIKLDDLNAKTNLQEMVQARGAKPVYRTVKEEGPPHNKTFTVEVLVDEQILGAGQGKSIKEAERVAASMGLIKLRENLRC